MGVPPAGSVIIVRFPFSDLTGEKVRPAVVLADAGRGDWVLCQNTSNAYSDPRDVPLSHADFRSGSLRVLSLARPAKLFTGNRSVIVGDIGRLIEATASRLVDAAVAVLRSATVGP